MRALSAAGPFPGTQDNRGRASGDWAFRWASIRAEGQEAGAGVAFDESFTGEFRQRRHLPSVDRTEEIYHLFQRQVKRRMSV